MAISKLFFVLFFVCLTVFATFVPVRVPFVLPFMPPLPDVQITAFGYGFTWGTYITNLQFMAVIATAFFLGPRLGLLTQIIYLVLGFSGVPIFYSGGGAAYWHQPSVGYLLAFIPTVLITGFIAFRKGNLNSTRCMNANWLLLAGIAGIIMSHLIGVSFVFFLIQARWWEILLVYVILPIPAQLTGITILSIIVASFHYIRFNLIKLFTTKPKKIFSSHEQELLKKVLKHGIHDT